jgi:hypothetical protein
MKYGVFRYSYSTNIGDEIQSIAAQRFLPTTDMSVERDRLRWYRGRGPLTVIFNGWFTRPPFPACWPPPADINPIFISWYAEVPETLITRETAEYFRKFEPIGCRSLPTVQCFERFGISAYHSGCLTLTIPRIEAVASEKIYIVDADPSLVAKVVPENVRTKAKCLGHITGESAVDLYLRVWNRLDRNMSISRAHRERLMHARHCRRMAMARERLALYSGAKLVITGRLHCAMPCLALRTPVVLLKEDMERDRRFVGLKELVRYRSDGSTNVNINWERPEPNSEHYNQFARVLEETCRDSLSSVGPCVA